MQVRPALDAVTLGAVTRSAPELAPSRRPRQVGRARWPATRTTRLLGSALLLCLVWAAMPTQQLSATATATGRLHSVLTRTSLGIRTVRVGYAHQWHRAACYQGPTHPYAYQPRAYRGTAGCTSLALRSSRSRPSRPPRPCGACATGPTPRSATTERGCGCPGSVPRGGTAPPGRMVKAAASIAAPRLGPCGSSGLRLSALTLTALPWQTAALRHPSSPRVLALAASKVTNPTTLCHPGLGRSGVATARYRGGGAAAAAARARHRPPRD